MMLFDFDSKNVLILAKQVDKKYTVVCVCFLPFFPKAKIKIGMAGLLTCLFMAPSHSG